MIVALESSIKGINAGSHIVKVAAQGIVESGARIHEDVQRIIGGGGGRLPAGGGDMSLITAIVDLKQGELIYKASILTLKSANEMDEQLIDMIG